MQTPVTLAALNALDKAAFVETIGFVFEDTPWIAAQVWQQRPFASLSDLYTALCRVMYEATPAQQLALICAHPDLAGRATQQGSLGTSSASEQATAGLDRLTPDEIEQFTRYNTAYRERFGFPFIICVRENKKAGILAGFAARLPNSRKQEIATALDEIARIAWLRLCDAVHM
ncbi:MAG: 2-oxo-4-hydroxy-4-carboxy-5-ureidoimidazoline decarboxylase [Chloroflexaceae bacterium]|nr:2-oxo-4-hydroxy-4-carboxy-5-ureidoimidazoline decarboxylase [Chloroflexaceae bacterium]